MVLSGRLRRHASESVALEQPVSLTKRSNWNSDSSTVRDVGKKGDWGTAPTKRPSSRPP